MNKKLNESPAFALTKFSFDWGKYNDFLSEKLLGLQELLVVKLDEEPKSLWILREPVVGEGSACRVKHTKIFKLEVKIKKDNKALVNPNIRSNVKFSTMSYQGYTSPSTITEDKLNS